MTDEELIARLRDDSGDWLTDDAADRIEALMKYRDAYAEMERIATEALRKTEARAERLEAALRKLHHAVCGETGFAACVRLDSGKAYPWPALDDADDAAATALAKVKEQKT